VDRFDHAVGQDLGGDLLELVRGTSPSMRYARPVRTSRTGNPCREWPSRSRPRPGPSRRVSGGSRSGCRSRASSRQNQLGFLDDRIGQQLVGDPADLRLVGVGVEQENPPGVDRPDVVPNSRICWRTACPRGSLSPAAVVRTSIR
jgi:hypothetical protein